MSTKKILFFNLVKANYVNAGGGEEAALICKDIANEISQYEPLEKQYDLSTTKFCLIDTVEDQNNIQKIVFHSATHKYRAPLMDREHGTQRDNPKLISEGERVKTHVIVKYEEQEVTMLVENGVGSLKIQQIINYLNHFANRYHAAREENRNYSIRFDIIAKDGFLAELNKLTRVIEGEIMIDKQILGSNALDFSERIEPVKHDVKLTIKASRGRSINNAITDAFNKLNGGASRIHKIRVRGKNDQDNDVLIDTEIIAKSEFVDAQLNQITGEVDSEQIFIHMTNIALAI